MADKFTDATKLKEVGRFLPRLLQPRRLVGWYHARYVAKNSFAPFVHVFVALSLFGWSMHER